MRPSLLAITFVISVLAAACTDWQAQGGATGTSVVSGAQPTAYATSSGRGVAADGGPTAFETWQAPDVAAAVAEVSVGVGTGGSDANGADGTLSDILVDSAAGSDADSADAPEPVEVVVVLPDGGTPDPDGGSADANAADGVADTSKDSAIDVAAYTFDGKADFSGWPDLASAKDTANETASTQDTASGADSTQDNASGADSLQDMGTVPDATASDTVAADAITPIEDSNQPPVDSAVPPDAVVDIALDTFADVAMDSAPVDSAQADTAQTDSTQADSGATDATGVDFDSAGTDGLGGDGSTDAGASDGAGPDGLNIPDWQGYPPDLPFAADADIYGGPIASCLSLWLYQSEACGDTNPTTECINTVAKDGSLYSQFLFDPLRECQTAVCTGLCAAATDKSCMEGCVGKYCTAQFLACTSNATSGTQDCANTWKCSQQYKDKLLTISAKCYANASFAAQKQFAGIISCVGKPQATSCLPQIAGCFAPASGGVSTCSATLSCINSCGSDENCSWTCMGNSTPKAVSLLDAIWTCQLQKCQPKCAGSPDPKCGDLCLQDQCKTELVQCLVD